MRYKFYASSYRTWKAMYRAIEDARESVYLETYIFLDDLHNFNFLRLLRQKAAAGVRVRVILDAWGSMGLSRASVATLRESGAEVFFYSHILHHIHRKILIVDERLAFIGGVNVHREALKWADLTIKIRGRLVTSILRSFAKVYAECGGRDPRILVHKKKIILDKTRTWLVEHFPEQKSAMLKKFYQESLRQAEKSVVLVTPYLVPKRWLIRALHQAVLRGIRVKVLMPKLGNHWLSNTAGYFFIHKLSLLGVEFYLVPHMNHAKAMLVDGRVGLVGSHNLDFFSFELNSEVGIVLKDPKAVNRLAEIIHAWKKEAVPFDPARYKPRLIDYILAPIVRILSWIL